MNKSDKILLESLYLSIFENEQSSLLRFKEGSNLPHKSERYKNPYYEGDGDEFFEIRYDDNGAEVYGFTPSGKEVIWSNRPFLSVDAAKQHLVKTGHIR